MVLIARSISRAALSVALGSLLLVIAVFVWYVDLWILEFFSRQRIEL